MKLLNLVSCCHVNLTCKLKHFILLFLSVCVCDLLHIVKPEGIRVTKTYPLHCCSAGRSRVRSLHLPLPGKMDEPHTGLSAPTVRKKNAKILQYISCNLQFYPAS